MDRIPEALQEKACAALAEWGLPAQVSELLKYRENAVFMFNSSGDPTLMREGNDMSAVYVVMPMRV